MDIVKTAVESADDTPAEMDPDQCEHLVAVLFTDDGLAIQSFPPANIQKL